MFNLLLGVLIGIAASWLYVQPHPVPWYAWGLFAWGATALFFGFDILIGFYKEHQPREAWMGLSMFCGFAFMMLLAVLGVVL